MNKAIHPECFEITAKCACGNKLKIVSANKDINIDICSSCHPFFTGTEKFIDTAGRIEKFKKRYAQNDSKSSTKKKTTMPTTTKNKK